MTTATKVWVTFLVFMLAVFAYGAGAAAKFDAAFYAFWGLGVLVTIVAHVWNGATLPPEKSVRRF